MLLDYATLKLVWWVFVAAIILVFALTDGWDLGIAMLSPWLGHTDEERRIILRAIEPNWEGNQTWLVIAGGVVFAAWPPVYAAAFSGMYAAVLLLLFALFLRPVGFKYRNKLAHPSWRRAWDGGLFIGAFVPALLFGAVFGNLLLGLPFRFGSDLRLELGGGFLQLLDPFAWVAGALAVAMLAMHGACYLQLRLDGELQRRAAIAARVAAVATLLLFAAAGVWVATGIDGYRIVSQPDLGGPPDPLAKAVVRASGAWLDNYARWPWTTGAPVLGFAGALGVLACSARGRGRLPLVASACAVAGILLTAGGAMFPFVLPSSTHPASSLTAWDAVSSHRTLQLMFWVVVVFLPLVALYTRWVYAKLAGKITLATLHSDA